MAWVGYIAVGIVLAASVVTAIGVFWKKVIKPAANFITLATDLKPLLEELVEVLRGKPKVFEVLNEIASQFRTDSGSSLRDVVNGLTESARKQEEAAANLRVAAKAQEQLASDDRAQRERLILKIDRINTKVDDGATAARVVASDLAASHKRADAVSGEAGAAADAAMKHPDKQE